MGWTVFACFGCTKKRKRPKIRRQQIQGYKALKSDTLTEQDVSKSVSIPGEKPIDETKARIRKKVRFNLQVVTYEPLSSYDEDHESNWEDRNDEETEQATAAAGVCLVSTEPNYRYNNCYVGEDEYDGDDDKQISDDEDEEEDEEDYIHDSDDDGCVLDLQSIYYEDLHDCYSRPLISSASNARLRSHYIVPVLNPIQNLSQWKAIKSRKN